MNRASSSGLMNLYYNSVYVGGTVSSGSALSFAFIRGSFSTPTSVTTQVNFRNNIFMNARTGGTGSHYAIANYGSAADTTGWGVNASDYNVLNSADSNTVGMWKLVSQTFSGWKSFSYGDIHSNSGITVTFSSVAAGNLHLSGSSVGDGNLACIPVTGITTDIDGDTRNTLYPYKGADENSTPAFQTLNITALIEGLYTSLLKEAMIEDTVIIELHKASSPWNLVASSGKIKLNSSGVGAAYFFLSSPENAASHYIAIKHRNAVETWSANPQTFTGGALSYDFTTASSKAYSDGVNPNPPMKQIGTKWSFWSGDVTHNYFVEYDDLLQVYNKYLLALEEPGYWDEDVTGNGFVEFDDVLLVYNNYSIGIWSQNPLNPVLSASPKKLRR
jgi:hypothetical protein